MPKSGNIPDNHPVRNIFRTLTERGLEQASLHDHDILQYIANMLLDFMYVDNLYRRRDSDGERLEYLVDILERAVNAESADRKGYYKHLGDYSLFMLGMFPEHLARPRRALSPDYYRDTGRIGYRMAGELESHWKAVTVFRKLEDKFEHCVLSLNWVREYTTDPFYQLMLRNFDS